MRCPDCGAENLAGAEDCESCSAPLASLASPQPKKGLPEKILSGTIAELKPREALTVEPSTPLLGVIGKMREGKTGCVLVLEGGRLCAILTERDLLYKVAGLKDPAKLKAKDVMRKDPVYLRPSQPVSFAFHHMSMGGYRHLPVQMDDGSITLISSRDLLAYLTN